MSAGRPRFDVEIAPGGYRWWYLDALSDDRRHGITVIALLGSVFSPYYARARRRGAADPLDHAAVNVALYGRGARRWTLTERGRRSVARTPERLAIGPSTLAWDGDDLVVQLDELGAPLPRRVRGTLRLQPAALTGAEFTLDAAARHRWTPIAPCARVRVELDRPRLSWSGAAYLDGNSGDAALEADFRRWHWSRTLGERTTTVLYDVDRYAGGPLSLALRFGADGRFTSFDPPTLRALPATGWRIGRATRSDPEFTPRIRETLEDTPFYARSVVASRLLGEDVVSMHESLSLERFARPWVRTLIPFRMPRALW